MADNGISIRLQREVGHLQQEIAQLQVELTQMDTKFDSRMNELRDGVQDEIKSELQSLFEQYLGHLSFTTIVGSSQDKGKGILGSPPSGFPPRDTMMVSPMVELGSLGTPIRGGYLESQVRSHKLDCPKFDGTDYRGWCSKLNWYFEAEGVVDNVI